MKKLLTLFCVLLLQLAQGQITDAKALARLKQKYAAEIKTLMAETEKKATDPEYRKRYSQFAMKDKFFEVNIRLDILGELIKQKAIAAVQPHLNYEYRLKNPGIITPNSREGIQMRNMDLFHAKYAQVKKSYDDVSYGYKNILFVVKKGNKWGVVDSAGQVVIPVLHDRVGNPSYNMLHIPYENGFAVQDSNKMGLFDLAGKTIIPIGDYNVVGVIDNLAPFSKGYRTGFYNKAGERIIDLTLNGTQNCTEGLWAVSSAEKQKWGFIDTTGKLVIDYSYLGVTPFEHGRALVFNGDDDAKLIDKKGLVISPPGCIKIEASQFNSSEIKTNKYFILVKNSRRSLQFGVIDATGKILVPAEYDVIAGDLFDHLYVEKYTTDGDPGKTIIYLYDVNGIMMRVN